MRKTIIFLALFIAIGFTISVTAADVQAKKKLPSPGASKSTTVKPKTTSLVKGVNVSVKFQPGRKGIIATFSNLGIASSVSYSLIYTSGGIQQGAGGSLSDLSGTQTRELLFGTCSSGVCRYHKGIKNARFVVTTTLSDGKKVSKTFRLKV